MEKRFTVQIEGLRPLLMNRNPGAQPSADKPPRGKITQAIIDKNKLQDWQRASYYKDGQGWFIPTENIEKMLSEGAAKFRMGKDFTRSVTVEEDFVPLLIGDGGSYKPANKPQMSYYPAHAYTRPVGIQGARIDRTRPQWPQWALAFTLLTDDSITLEQIQKALTRNNLGDWRPRFGGFTLKEVKEL